MQPYCPNNSNFTFKEIVCVPCKKPHNHNNCFDNHFEHIFPNNYDWQPNFYEKPNNFCPPFRQQKIAPFKSNCLLYLFIGYFIGLNLDCPTHQEHFQ